MACVAEQNSAMNISHEWPDITPPVRSEVMSPSTDDGVIQPIRVLICNKYTLFREGLPALLQQGIVIEAAAEASTAKEALKQLARVKPDVVLLDATTPDESSSLTVQRMKSIFPDARILILSLYDDDRLVNDCLAAGATGYIRRDDSAFNLKRTINRACGRGARGA
jgi:two-component system response regulator DegU